MYFRDLKILIFFLMTCTMTAQTDIIFKNRSGLANGILSTSDATDQAAFILKRELDKAFSSPFVINNKKSDASEIILVIDSMQSAPGNFVIKSDAQDIYLIAADAKYLKYAVYSLLEYWGFRKFTATVAYIPEFKKLAYPKNSTKIVKPAFEYRALFFPDGYDADFREWHKLDWHIDDFGLWGHSFNRLLPPKIYFTQNPQLFALYEGKRRPESLCMSNDTVVDLVAKSMQEIIAKQSDAKFYSVSQNDDMVYCECAECSKLNKISGGPQGSLYHFLNKIALRFPDTRITTLAYLHTYKPPTDIAIQPNIHTIFCPIEQNRGSALANNQAFTQTLERWKNTTSQLFVWDYVVQFSNYMSPFPNWHTFSDNYKLFKKNNVKGLFVQGYADVPGDLSELRQYVLAKLLWDPSIDIDATTNDFLRGYYGKAAPAIKKYLDLLTYNQQQDNQFLDIYSGPVQSRNSFLRPAAMDQYDQLIEEAEALVALDHEFLNRVVKLRMALEFVYFEQSKFYGKEAHGMFVTNTEGKTTTRKGLTERVKIFTQKCRDLGIYELSEEGLTPEKYYEEWLEIAANQVTHNGEKIDVKFVTAPDENFEGKGSYGLVDGNRGYKDFNINWLGWYGNNPELELTTADIKYKKIRINFLEDQRHWIFPPKAIVIYGWAAGKWQKIGEEKFADLTENYRKSIKSWDYDSNNFSKFTTIKIIVLNQEGLPSWRQRKFKEPMVMIDEIEFYD